MSNPNDWAEVAAEALTKEPQFQHYDWEYKPLADAIRTALAGYRVIPMPDYVEIVEALKISVARGCSCIRPKSAPDGEWHGQSCPMPKLRIALESVSYGDDALAGARQGTQRLRETLRRLQLFLENHDEIGAARFGMLNEIAAALAPQETRT